VTLTGTGWDPGEAVNVAVNDDEGKTWSYSNDVTADASGEFTVRFDLPTTFVALYQVTATGAVSGTARTSFTDGNVTAATVAVRRSNCTTAATSFILTDVVCAHSSITTVTGNQIGDAFVQWVNPSNAVVSTVTHSNAHQGDTFDDSFTPNVAGTWTVKVCSNNGCSQTLDSKTFTVAADTTAPVITANVTGTLGNNNWYTSDVNVTWNVSDPETTVTSTTGCGPSSVTSDTAGVTFTCQATSAGGTSSQSVTVKRDATAPNVTLAFGRTPDHNGWYTSSVTISANGTDAMSQIASCASSAYSGPDNASASVSRSCSDNAGNSASASGTIKYDATGPTANLAVSSGTAGSNGWYTSNVTVHTSGADAVSGPVTCTGDQSQTTETGGHVFNGSCTNDAGLSTNAAPLTVKLDKTAPTAVALAVTAGTAGVNGWYTSDVTLQTSGSEDMSTPLTCSGDQHQTTETTGTIFNGSCTNDAGLTTNAIAKTIKLDKSGPSATLAVTDGTPGNNGWYISDVTLETSGADTISSPVSCTGAQHQTTDTSGADFHGSCTNDAGLTTNANTVTIKRDHTNPSVSLAFGRDADHNGWYTHSVLVSANGTDDTSQIASCESSSYSGPETASGTVTRSCEDNAGNVGSASESIKYDETGPTATLSVSSGTLGTNDWYTSDVTIHATGNDAVSGPVTCTEDQHQTAETLGATFNGSCTNDAGLSTPAASLTVKVDKSGPSAAMAVTAGTAGANGWYTSDVTVSTSGSDPVSDNVHCTGDQFQTTETAGHEFHAACTNDAGLSTDAASLTVKLDKTAPSASLAVTAGTLGTNGWYTSNVTLSTTGSDSISSPVVCSANQFQNDETTGQAFVGMCVNDAGLGANSNAITIKLDKTGPSAAMAVTAGTAGANGWYTSDVTVSTSGSDPVSDNVHCTGDQFQTTETAGHEFHGSCTNDAGLTTPADAVTVNLDKSGPSASLSASGTHGANGWFTSDVTVSTSGADAISEPVTCTSDQSQTTETTGATFDGHCTNDAGLSTDATALTVKLDKTGPTADLSVTAGTPGAHGWYTSDVTVHTSGTDTISSPVTCDGDQSQSSETTGTDFHGSCTNDAGLTTNAAPLTVKLDKTGPSAVLSASGTHGANGWFIDDVTISTAGTDSISSPVTCTTDQSQTSETIGTLFNGSCTNDAGLSMNAIALNVRLDKTGPTGTSLSASGPHGTNGWFTGNVTVSTSGTDSVSSPVHCTADQFQTDETSGHTFNGSCTNDAGLATSAAPLAVKLDKSGPSASLAVTAGTAGTNGWYTSDVTVHTSGADSISGPVTCDDDQYQTAETTGTDFHGSCTNDAGLSTNASTLTVKLDKSGPSAALSVTGGTLGAHGWYTSDVTVHTAGSDSISGPPTCTSDQSQNAETTGHVFNGSCTNAAGLTTNASPLGVKLDKTGPSASLSASGTHGTNGWFTTDVTVSGSGSDSISSPVSCTPDQSQTSETTGQVFNGSCTNDAGLSTNAAPLTVKLDKTGPSATLSVTAGTLGTNGWYTSNVTVHTAGSDSVSSPVTCTLDQQQTTETAAQAFNGSCTNNAGLSTNATALTVKLDKTAPTISSANDGQSYQLGSSQTVTFSCSDLGALSGLASCNGSVANLSSLSTTPVGPHSYSVNASDNAGNTSAKTIGYTVGYRFDGFLQPINDTAHQVGLYESKFKLGSTVPVKLQLKNGGGTAVQAATVPGFSYKKLGSSCDSLTDTESTVAVDATSGSSFRWDSSLAGYIYNFSTKSLTAGEYRIYASLDDGSTQTVDLCMTR
jgi:hypothetical protein